MAYPPSMKTLKRGFVGKSLAALWFALCLFIHASYLQAEEPRPNILLIVSDDQGYADTGFQGSQEIRTPHLDQLAKSGVLCTSGYVSHPFCSPTRAALMTGRYQQRFGHVYNPFYNPSDEKEGLPLSEKLLPEYLHAAGYVTGWIGKWHLGAAPAFAPEKRGFDEGFGFIGGGHHYFNWKTNAGEYNIPILRNGEAVDVPEHYTGRVGSEAETFVKNHATHPWFLYLAFNAPHTPHEPTPERVTQFSPIKNRQRARYAAQISLMDDAIGDLLTTLEATHQSERTLIFFFTDNGGPLNAGAVNTPLRGGKGDTYEGGVRVPFLVSWPGHLAAGTKYDQPVSSLDVFATSLALASTKMPTDKPYDSVNLLPYLRGENKSAPHDRLFWRTGTGQKAALREGDWKLVRAEHQPDELYHLSSDIGESNNLASTESVQLKQMSATLDAWEKQMPPPAFIGTSFKDKIAETNTPPAKPGKTEL